MSKHKEQAIKELRDDFLKIIDDIYYTPKLDHKRIPELAIFIKELKERLLKKK
jgi:hypothetical protein